MMHEEDDNAEGKGASEFSGLGDFVRGGGGGGASLARGSSLDIARWS